MESFVKENVSMWIDDNKDFFRPPVCNKFMHQDGQINVMFVGGPNSRKDFHIECGEELFYQVKGDMVLKVIERGRHKDILIKEGEIFLLPRAIPHSPQRFLNTVGLVIERRRKKEEFDMLRYFSESDGQLSTEVLYDLTFHWEEDGARMPELFQQFQNSEQFRTGRPINDSVPKKNSLLTDSETTLQDPFSLMDWIKKNNKKIQYFGKLSLFDTNKHQFQVSIYGKCEISECNDIADIWIWQLKGNSVIMNGENRMELAEDNSLLIPTGNKFTIIQEEHSLAIVIYQDPTKASPST